MRIESGHIGSRLRWRPFECPEAPEVVLPAGSYPGKLIDTHFHMPHIPDSRPGAEPGENELGDFGEGRFYDWMSEPEESDPIRGQQPFGRQEHHDHRVGLSPEDGRN